MIAISINHSYENRKDRDWDRTRADLGSSRVAGCKPACQATTHNELIHNYTTHNDQ